MKICFKLAVHLILLLSLSACQTNFGSSFISDNSDSAVTQRVQQALYMNDDPVIANLHAESIQGTVVLTGFVKKIKQSDDAEASARNIPGVKEVKNNIIVRS